MRRASSHTISCDSDNVGLMGKALFTLLAVFASLLGKGAGEPYFTGRGGPFFPVRASAQGSLCVGRAFGPPHRPHVAGGSADFFSRVFSYSAALGPFRRATLHAISRDSDNFGPMGEALFTLFAVFWPPFGQGAGVP